VAVVGIEADSRTLLPVVAAVEVEFADNTDYKELDIAVVVAEAVAYIQNLLPV